MKFIICSEKDAELFSLVLNNIKKADVLEAVGQQKLQSVVGDVDASKTGRPVALCERCGKDIYSISKTPEKTIEYSQKFHDGVFCYNCQQVLRKNKKTMDGVN